MQESEIRKFKMQGTADVKTKLTTILEILPDPPFLCKELEKKIILPEKFLLYLGPNCFVNFEMKIFLFWQQKRR